MTGTKAGHYEILDKLGEGGMGMVFRARDLLLNRPAALKFLPPEFGATPEKRTRFLQEAQAASALNHPNIITIYEVAQSEGRDFIAMELIQGRPLDEAIGTKGLPVAQAVDYAIHIAAALAAAHAAGIVHRDLKPGNVMISSSGLVKVLDFGLAKLTDPSSSEDSITRTIVASAKTAEGAIVGTVSYMSPEQAEGKPVDHRSDIFAFGALLYEMLSGKRAFLGDSTVSTLAAILTADPAPLPAEPAGVPRDLVRIVNRCLRKQRERRWQTIADVKIALEEFKQDLDSGVLSKPAASPSARQRSPWIPAAAVGLAAALLAGLAVWQFRPAPAPVEQWRIRRLTADVGASFFPTLSPDGKFVAYSSDRAASNAMDIWVQPVEGGDPVRLTQDLTGCFRSSFSADGSKVAFECDLGGAGKALYVVSAFGGLPRRIGEGIRPRFSPDGSKIAYLPNPAATDEEYRTIRIVPADGGDHKEIKTTHDIFVGHAGVVWSPDGKGLVFIGGPMGPLATRRPDDWYFLSEDGKSETPLGMAAHLKNVGMEVNWGPHSASDEGFLLIAGAIESANIYRVGYDQAARKVISDPVPIIVGTGFNFAPWTSKDGSRIAFSVGSNLSTNLWRIPLDAAGVAKGEPVKITDGLLRRHSPSPSSDGRKLVYAAGMDSGEIRIRDLDTGKELRLAEARSGGLPLLSPDGSQVAYFSAEGGKRRTFLVPSQGGVPRVICESCGRPTQWIGGGTRLLYDSAGFGGNSNAGATVKSVIGVLDVATRQGKTLIEHPKNAIHWPHLSPDGRLLVFSAITGGRTRQIYTVPYTGEPVAEKDWTVLVDGKDFDRQPYWAPSGKLVYFLSDRDGSRCMWAQPVDPATGKAAGEAFAARHFHEIRYNLGDMGDPAAVGLSIVQGQLFYATSELQSNVWIAERQRLGNR